LNDRRTNKSKGFTLLEVLVVMLLISIILTIALLNLDTRRSDEEIYEQARRLTRQIELASQESLIKSWELGLLIQSDYYQFFRFDEQEWKPVQHDILGKYQIPDNMEMLLTLEGLSENLQKDTNKATPQIMLLSSGEHTPFEITFRSITDYDSVVSISGTLIGKLTLQRSQENE
jgi:general secretion pathway protein H